MPAKSPESYLFDMLEAVRKIRRFTAATSCAGRDRPMSTSASVSNSNVRERQYVEFRAEFFNRFNQVNLANPISDLNAVAVPGGSSQCGDRTDHQFGIVRPDHLGHQ